ncbi:tRNA pseudouridine synthase C [Pontibacter ummariensis]|uniref:tRNA pseudouridine synthase C n=1 Tax=Pontibacter ummariensis TaxID=1610492 RepID=A0A239BV97_9BACT|nr:pseudouridine synthase [Pontibacter ummariensis]PRY15622.1 tRNA pseudouridine synthase C [Pontibacter ummariensis]SNS11351.1 tRNA pseudouridine synthase C [Pontibacter ummariensis]
MLEIIYEDAHYVAINKPNGLLVHRTRIAEEKKEFALQMLRDQLGYHLFTVHRLDRGTSGVLLFAKSPEAASPIVKAFEERQPDKTYVAIVRGYTPEAETIDNPIRPDKDHQHKAAQEAVTHYCRLGTVELPIPVGRYTTARYSLVKVEPETGRMHQIRKHFAHIRHYIVGDKRHGDWRHNKMFLEELHSPYLLLHAAELAFAHPFTGKTVRIKAQLPDNMRRLCWQFGWEDVLAQQESLPQPVPAPTAEVPASPSRPACEPPRHSESRS